MIMAVTKDEILDAISKMSVMEVVELISDMEKKFNVTAAAPVAAAPAGAGAAAAPAAEAQTEFTVTMTEFGANKVGVIDRQGSYSEDGCRDDQEEAGGRWRQGRHQVVIIAGTRSSMFAAPSAAAVGCALDFDVVLAPRAIIRRDRLGSVTSARSAWQIWKG